jgi:hypothetical protein
VHRAGCGYKNKLDPTSVTQTPRDRLELVMVIVTSDLNSEDALHKEQVSSITDLARESERPRQGKEQGQHGCCPHQQAEASDK